MCSEGALDLAVLDEVEVGVVIDELLQFGLLGIGLFGQRVRLLDFAGS